jgi:hypothetical protein
MYRRGWNAVAPFVDYYQILGVHRQAEPEVIDAAFRAMARRFHPDHNVGDRSASERTRQVIEAHAVLSDPEKRRVYNRDWDAQPLRPPPVAKEPPAPRPAAPQPKPPPSTQPFASRPPSQPAAAKDRPKQRPSNWGRGVTFLVLALISTAIAITLVITGGNESRGTRGDSAFIVLICLAGGLYFGHRAWSIFQAERSLVGLTEENITQALAWGKRTACPPAGRGCFETPRSIGEARQTCTWSGLCRIGGIMLRDGRRSQSWEVWIDGRTGLGRLRQRGRQTR